MEATSCCACLVADQKLYSVEENNLKQALEDLTDLPVGISSLPLYLCYLCRALVMKFAAFRAAYRYTHLILRAMHKGQIINGEVSQQEQNVRRMAGFSLATSNTINIDIYSEKDNNQICTAGRLKSEVNDNKNLKKLKTKKDSKSKLFEKAISIDSDLIRNQIENSAGFKDPLDESEIDKVIKSELVEQHEDSDLIRNEIESTHSIFTAPYDLLDKIDDNKEINNVQNDHDYTMSDCGDADKDEGKENNQEFRTSDINSDIWDLDPDNELENFYSNKRIKLTQTSTEDNDRRIENNKTSSKIYTNKEDEQNGNDIDVDQQINKKTYVDRYDIRNIVFPEPDKYTYRRSMKTLQDYEEFAKRYKMKVGFFLTEEEQMKAFLARKETDKYKKAPYKCELCYIGFMTSSAHTNHMKKHIKYEYRRFECEFCHRYYAENTDRRDHLETHRVYYTCLQCGEVLIIKWCLEKHFKVHAGFRYECKTCLKTFRLQSMYYKHIRQHGSTNGSSSSLAKCPFCEKALNGPIGLRNHMYFVHPEALGCFCDSCDRQFSNEAARTAHEDSCSADNSPCVRCGASFPSDERLAEHVAEQHKPSRKGKRRHQSKDKLRFHRNYCLKKKNKEKCSTKPRDRKLCEVCGKTAKNIYTLRDHMRIHTGERPYKCTECGKTFRLLTSLQIHMRTHTDLRRYKCSLCSKAFRQDPHLRAHMFSHTKERPFACKTCPKTYTSQGSLKEHVDIAHRGLPPRQRPKKREKQEL